MKTMFYRGTPLAYEPTRAVADPRPPEVAIPLGKIVHRTYTAFLAENGLLDDFSPEGVQASQVAYVETLMFPSRSGRNIWARFERRWEIWDYITDHPRNPPPYHFVGVGCR